ncbi:hypothetical protein DSUL_50163 [Desulfovibrionales bacterium]
MDTINNNFKIIGTTISSRQIIFSTILKKMEKTNSVDRFRLI